jgi:transcriptional regulator GlxA family with amidase domain
MSQASRNRVAPDLRTLLERFPAVPIFAAFDVQPGRWADLSTVARWGVVDVISIGHDDTPVALRKRFRSATARALKALLQTTLPVDTPGHVRAIVEAAAETAAVAGNARYMARALNVSRRTLLRWTERAGVSPPRRLLAWMRILLAAELLDDPGRTVGSVARACGYSDDSGLRAVMRQFVRATPTELRRIGAVEYAARTFIRELAQLRHGDP